MARVLIAAALLGLVTVGDAFLYLTLQPRDNLATDYYVLLMVGMNVSYLLFAVPLGRLPDRIRRAKIFVSGHVALLGCYIRWNQIGLMNAILLVCFPVAAVIMRGLDRSRTA
jgi:MFS family permease